MELAIQRAAAVCGLTAALFALAVPLVGGCLRPGYDQGSQYISELGEQGAVHGAAVSLCGFLPTGLLVLAFIGGVVRSLPQTAVVHIAMLCLSGVGFAYITAAFARCDPGCPQGGSPAQDIHNLLGLVEYVGALLGLSLLAWAVRTDPGWQRFRTISIGAALGVLIGFTGMLAGEASMRGLWQRLAEVAIFGWILSVSLRLLFEIPSYQRGR